MAEREGTRVIGLTGGIASGKSTVAGFLQELGAPIVDADQVARQVVEPGTPALAEIAGAWPEVVDAGGRLDRKKLGDIVFADPDARRRLEQITHPRIAAASQKEVAAHAARGEPVVIYEAALIVENRLYTWMDGLIVVSAPEQVQIQRLMERDGIDREAARARIAAQLPLAKKRDVATWIIENDGSLEETRARTREVWRRISEQVRTS